MSLILENMKEIDMNNKAVIKSFYWAAEKGYFKIIKLLLYHRIDVNIQNQDGYAPLHAAVRLFGITKKMERFALNEEQRGTFEIVVAYCGTNITQVPLSFVLGFYVSLVMSRWWDQFQTIPYPDNMALLISAGIKGNDEHCRIIRRTLGRYACLSFAATLALISPKVKKRFPTLQHLVDAGLMMPDEKKIMQGLTDEYPNYPQFWLPLAWASNIAARARQEGLIRTDVGLNSILQEINIFRTKCGGLLNYDWINIPLVYTQVITIAVYTYFLTSVIGRQLVKEREDILYFPFLAVLEFFFYMGWVRVAETLINPFGEDDDDFDVVWMIDRHVQVTYLIVDKIHEDYPQLMQDQYWNTLVPKQLPFTVASEKYREDIPQSSTANMNITEVDAEISLSPKGPEHDSIRKRSPSIIKRLFGSQREHPHSTLKDNYHLTTITTEEKPGSKQDRDTIDTPTATLVTPQSSREDDIEDGAGEVVDFEKLKKLRQMLIKQKVIKYMDLMRQHTIDEEDKIINNIIHVGPGENEEETPEKKE
ncbi:Bestrophin, RFP-TM, chloride channel [Popillia japonica]|uniref:Bestrophin homolog n=1 Tax=Popillia japonica TaxID=7064 RepID=A0AAW1JH80_POPJA